MTNFLSCLHVIASIHPDGGGTSRTAQQLAGALAVVDGVRICLLTQSLKNEPIVQSNLSGEDLLVRETASRQALRFGLPIREELHKIIRNKPPDFIHDHGVWLPANHWVVRVACRYRVPLLIQPHGMLEPWSLKHNVLKKKLAMTLYQYRDLSSATVFLATSQQEYHSIRNLGLAQPVAIIPNGIVPNSYNLSTSQRKQDSRVRTVLFLSRVHKKKGLLNLIYAWGKLRPHNWRLVIAGPNEGGHLDEVMAAVRQLRIEDYVEYLGVVEGDTKTTAYQNADLFILPSHSENFGVVVAEALSNGLPVITTRGTPWADLEKYECGWWIDIGVEPLVAALQEAMAMNDDQRQAMGDRGRLYVQRFDWGIIAQQMADVYRWVLGQGAKPDCVRTD